MLRKRKKGSKLVRMNEEERIRYMQYRLEFELETKRRKRNFLIIIFKINLQKLLQSKLKHEEVFSKLNIAKINEKWRYVLRQIRCKEFHKNVKYLHTTFDRVVKIKDATISELHDMYKLNNVKMNSMIELTELKNYIGQYKEIANNITRKYIIFDQTRTIRKTYNATNIFNILYLEKDMASDFIHQAFLKIEKFWEQLSRIINEYQRIVENKKKQYEYLKKQDDVHQMYILQYPEIYLQLQNIIETLKVNVRILSQKRKVQIAELKMKDINIQKRYKNIKYKFTVTQMIGSVQLKKLIVRSNEVLKYLQRILKKSSTILDVIKICTTLEPLFFNLEKYSMQNALYTEYVGANIPESCAKVNNFWEYYNYIKGNNILLKKQNNELCRKNKKLKCKLQMYFSVDSSMLIYLITSLFYYFLSL
ncbi:Coiled-coil domain-containing protein 65 [Melipona quadrifasciata]|uniref:Dynein regulatory complex subunit 2 n=1 Tax=Melipona quadrifasciata TaxID=166423 RepID=A0A0M9A033_9HYME|nr:Coiled-coil domain-containing protein 65 [Melipona quadrifasciata]